jgi:putative FmdB family regulatory protein
MPLYEYRCDACGHQFEVIQKFSDAPIATCRACGGSPVVKLLSSPAIQFKGEGWYITDYARKDQKAKDANRGDRDSKKADGDAKSSSSSDSAPSSPPAKPAGPSSKTS